MANLPCLTSAPIGQIEGFVWRSRTEKRPRRSALLIESLRSLFPI